MKCFAVCFFWLLFGFSTKAQTPRYSDSENLRGHPIQYKDFACKTPLGAWAKMPTYRGYMGERPEDWKRYARKASLSSSHLVDLNGDGLCDLIGAYNYPTLISGSDRDICRAVIFLGRAKGWRRVSETEAEFLHKNPKRYDADGDEGGMEWFCDIKPLNIPGQTALYLRTNTAGVLPGLMHPANGSVIRWNGTGLITVYDPTQDYAYSGIPYDMEPEEFYAVEKYIRNLEDAP